MVDDRGATRRPIRVLVVDDQPSMRLLMRTLLERDGCVVEESSDGLDALGRLTPALDVVVMDVMMPGLDGISTVRRLRELDRTLPVVLVTALADREARVAGKAAGADDFLTKPIDAAELCARVRVLGQTKALTDRVASERTRLAELEVAQDAVARLERLATLGTLAAGVGHELKNLAMVVQGVGLELSEGDPAEDAPSMLERVGRHLASLGQHLMRLGNDRIGDVEPVDVGLVVRQVHELLTRAGRLSGTTAVVEIDPTCGPAHANALELEQVLINLLGNAIDAVDGRELRRIGVGVEPAVGGGVRIRITDSGCGMSRAVLGRGFEPYFTTKPPGRGTGLGLPVVKQRVEGWSGAIVLNSAEGVGTVVVVNLGPARS